MTIIASGCFYAAVVILAGVVLFACLETQRKQYSPYSEHLLEIIIAGVFISAVFLHFPLYYANLASESAGVLKSILSAVHHSLRLFILDGETDPIHEFFLQWQDVIPGQYFMFGLLLYLIAPALTFSFILSFLQDVSSFWRLLFYRGKEVYVFSELNESTRVLAQSLKENHPEGRILFCGASQEAEDVSENLLRSVKECGAVVFKQEITELRLSTRAGKKRFTLFAASEDESKNIQQALLLMKKYGQQENYSLYVFSTGIEGELIFQNVADCRMTVRRLDEKRSFLFRTMYTQGNDIFASAVECNGEKQIGAAIVGMGEFGSQLMRILPWCCQMDGYHLRLDAFDRQSDAAAHFCDLCPELMAPERNGTRVDGEAEYEIRIHDGVEMESPAFTEQLDQMPVITFAFVDLGNDSENVKAAKKLREYCARRKMHPMIHAIVRDPEKAAALQNVTNFKGVSYDISFVGSLEECCTEDALLNSELDQLALARHLRWGEEKAFWAYEYNYRASVASALHQKLRIQCGIPGAEKPSKERSKDETVSLAKLEHKRWNAYMRAEGYCFSGSTDEKTRDDLAKLHHCLVPFSDLPEKEKWKDDV